MATITKTAHKKAAPRKSPDVNALHHKLDVMAKQPNGISTKDVSDLINSVTTTFSAPPPMPFSAGANFVSELNNIDFEKMIGGPLQACVNAQVKSSMATVDFIKTVGFKQDNSGNPTTDLVMVDFTFKKPADTTATQLTVPLLAMLQIPSLRIEHVIIDFNVKLNSVETSSSSLDIGVNASASGGFGPVKFKVSASVQRKSTTGMEIKKEYALNVNVKAVQDEMPAGLEKILGMLGA